MDSNKALKQLPFNGKKTKPTKLRRDYWAPMALVQFPKGEGVVGQSAFQKLREFRRLHELAYPRELLALSRAERGRELNSQKTNSVADMAVVLAGMGAGNLIRREVQDAGGNERPSPVETTIYWADERDRFSAESWPANITHQVGIPRPSRPAATAQTDGEVDAVQDSPLEPAAA